MPLIVESTKPYLESVEALGRDWVKEKNVAVLVAGVGVSFATETLWAEGRSVIPTKYIPEQLLARYRRAAMKRVETKRLEDGSHFATIPGFDGVWANEETLQDCLNVLDEMVTDWLVLKIEDNDHDIPVLDDIDLNVI
jgi:hypothetical protein